MIRCNHCKRLFNEEALLLVEEDPSPRGICLPGGHETYAYCPHCGSDDVEDFSLADALDIEEGNNGSEAVITFGDRAVMVYVTDNGELNLGWFRYVDTKKEKQKKLASAGNAPLLREVSA